MARLFGTDGIRGVVNVDLKPTTAYALGRAVAHRLVGHGGAIVVGQDTRRSGDMFVAAIAAGATSLGVDVHIVGVVPTPALAYITGVGPFDAGIMVSASHNPALDNGLKVLDAQRPQARRLGRGRARAAHLADRGADRRTERRARPDGRGQRATGRVHGASTGSRRLDRRWPAPPGARRRERLGIRRRARRSSRRPAPGRGHPRDPRWRQHQRRDRARQPQPRWPPRSSQRAPMSGFALDGDADRLIAVDHAGRIVDGDQVLGILALDRLSRDELPGGGLVVSVLSNGGLQTVVEAAGGQVVRTPVGDKYILEGMQVSGAVLGGEKSGHVIVLEHTTSGDGVVTALEVLRVMTRRSASLGELAAAIPMLPQQQRAVKARHKDQWEGDRAPPAVDRRRDRPARSGWPGPRPTVGHGACVAGDGRGPGRGARRRAGRRARDPRRGATRLALVPIPRSHHDPSAGSRRARTEDSTACAASSDTRDRGKRAPSSSKD